MLPRRRLRQACAAHPVPTRWCAGLAYDSCPERRMHACDHDRIPSQVSCPIRHHRWRVLAATRGCVPAHGVIAITACPVKVLAQPLRWRMTHVGTVAGAGDMPLAERLGRVTSRRARAVGPAPGCVAHCLLACPLAPDRAPAHDIPHSVLVAAPDWSKPSATPGTAPARYRAAMSATLSAAPSAVTGAFRRWDLGLLDFLYVVLDVTGSATSTHRSASAPEPETLGPAPGSALQSGATQCRRGGLKRGAEGRSKRAGWRRRGTSLTRARATQRAPSRRHWHSCWRRWHSCCPRRCVSASSARSMTWLPVGILLRGRGWHAGSLHRAVHALMSA